MMNDEKKMKVIAKEIFENYDVNILYIVIYYKYLKADYSRTLELKEF